MHVPLLLFLVALRPGAGVKLDCERLDETLTWLSSLASVSSNALMRGVNLVHCVSTEECHSEGV